MNGKKESRIAKEVAFVARGNNGTFFGVLLSESAGWTEGQDRPFDGFIAGSAILGSCFFQDMAADLVKNLLPFGTARKVVTNFFKIKIKFIWHVNSP